VRLLDRSTIHCVICVCFLVAAGAVESLNAAPCDLRRFSFEEPCMGTLFRLQFFAEGEEGARRVAELAFAEAHRLDRMLSDYHPGSDLMRLCAAPAGVAYDVPAELYDLLGEAKKLYDLSDGAFDITLGHLTKEWRRAIRKKNFPSARMLRRGLEAKGGSLISLGEDEQAVVLGKPGMLLDLGGIAKGYVADRMLEIIVASGYPSAVVSAGGDLRAGEAPPGTDGWEVNLRPFGGGDETAIIRVSAECLAVSTSGSVHQYAEIDGRRYSHILNPATGLGIDPGLACTVLAKNGCLSDSLATTFCILGIDKGLKLAEELGVEVLFARCDVLPNQNESRKVFLISSPKFHGTRVSEKDKTSVEGFPWLGGNR